MSSRSSRSSTRRRAREVEHATLVAETDLHNRRNLLLSLPHTVLAHIAEMLHPAAVVRLSAASKLVPRLPCCLWRESQTFAEDYYYGDSPISSEYETDDDDWPPTKPRAYHHGYIPPEDTSWRHHPFDSIRDPDNYGYDEALTADVVLRVAHSTRLSIVGGLWVEAQQADLARIVDAVVADKEHRLTRLRLKPCSSDDDSESRSYTSGSLPDDEEDEEEDEEEEGEENAEEEGDLSMLQKLPHLMSLALNVEEEDGCGSSTWTLSELKSLPATLHDIDLTFWHISTTSALARFAQLRMLTLDCCTVLRSLEGLQHCPHLACLKLNSCTYVESLAPLSGTIHKELRALNLSRTSVTSLSCLDGCPLVHLNIDNCAGSVVHDLTYLPSLTRLHGMAVEGVSHLAPVRALSSLVRLDFRLSETLEDVTGLADCTALQHLCLLQCKKLTSVDAIASCVQLVSLNLSGLSRLASVRALAFLPVLQKVKLSEAKQLDVTPLGDCPRLRKVDLSSARSLKGVAALGRSGTLQTLDLREYKPKIAVAQMRILVQCASLQLLTLYGCEWFDMASVATGTAPDMIDMRLRIKHDGEFDRARGSGRRRRRRRPAE